MSGRYYCFSEKRRQRGVVTVLITVVILAAITVMVLFAAQTAILDQRMSANEIRMKQAAGAAQAGIERAFAEINSGTGLPAEVVTHSYEQADGGTYFSVAFLEPGTEIEGCPRVPETGFPENSAVSSLETLVFACGWSDDRSARKGIAVLMRAGPSMGAPPTNPLTSLGGVATNGRARVFNYFNNLTIWTGDLVDVTGNPGNTFIRSEATSQPANINLVTEGLRDGGANQVIRDYYVETTDRSMIGPDVIDGDLSLRALEDRGGDAFFENFMGSTRDDYQNQSLVVDNADDLAGLEGQSIWLEGSVGEISGNHTIGSRDEPVVLVSDGDLDISGNVTIYGVLYVAGDLTGSGTVTNYGSSLIEGETLIRGTPYFIFDPDVSSRAANVGMRGIVSGTWRDWADR